MSDEDGRQRMQQKTFTAWVNSHLSREGLAIENLSTDFADGIKLIKLVEVISEEPLGKYNKKPFTKFQKVENLNIPLKYINEFIKALKISNQYTAENILDENTSLILGMVWTLILRFNVSQISEGDRTAKEGLLLWAQNKVREGSKGTIEVINFHTSWQDGMAFNALIQAYRPDLVDVAKMHKKNGHSNLENAFEIAEKHIGIPRMLDANDMIGARPDEKSVMTYVSFFWKEFAANKRKKIAATRVIAAVQREVSYDQLMQQYSALAAALDSWLESSKATFESEHVFGSIEEAENALLSYVEYGREGKPAKFKDLLEVEVLFSSITSRLATLNRSYTPPEELSVASLQRRWAELAATEVSYEEKLHLKVKSLKQVSHLMKLFNGKAGKIEDFMKAKAVWTQVNLEKVRGEMMLAAEKYERASSARSQVDYDLPALMPAMFTPENLPTSLPGSPRASLSGEAAASPAIVSPSATKRRSRSLVAGLFSALTPRTSRVSKADETEEDATPDPGAESKGVEILQIGSFNITTEVEEARAAVSGEPALESIAAVQAKLNMLSAVEEELAGRMDGKAALKKLLDDLTAAGCPPFRTFSLQNRYKHIESGLTSLQMRAVDYKQVLHAAMAHNEKFEEMRLFLAKKTDALNRWFDESIEMLTESFELDSPAEVDTELAELESFKLTLSTKEKEVQGVEFYAAETELLGVIYNPYTRFTVNDINACLSECAAEVRARESRLEEAKASMVDIDSKKRDFAKSAESVILFLKGEKQTLEAATPPISIVPDDAESIKHGKRMVEALKEYASLAGKRAKQLDHAQELSDTLYTAGELQNKYTTESMASLKSQLDVLEKLVVDKQRFVEGQIATAEVDMSPEQRAELEAAFHHFDKSGDGYLNMDEFAAAIKSMDFENPDVEMQAFFDKNASPRPGSDEDASVITLDNFVAFVAQQYKDHDSMDGLLAAFRVLSGGKDTIPSDVVQQTMGEEEASYLLERIERAGNAYTPFTAHCYGVEEAAVPLG